MVESGMDGWYRRRGSEPRGGRGGGKTGGRPRVAALGGGGRGAGAAPLPGRPHRAAPTSRRGAGVRASERLEELHQVPLLIVGELGAVEVTLVGISLHAGVEQEAHGLGLGAVVDEAEIVEVVDIVALVNI